MATRVGLITRSPDETRALGAAMGRWLDRPAVIALTGELGSGKTCFVQGLAEGLDVPPEFYVTSPSYTLINEYPGRLPLYHVDLYRLDSVDDSADIGLDEALHGDGVAAIEWPDRLPEGSIIDPISIHISEAEGGDDQRKFEVTATGWGALMASLEGYAKEGKFMMPPPAGPPAT